MMEQDLIINVTSMGKLITLTQELKFILLMEIKATLVTFQTQTKQL